MAEVKALVRVRVLQPSLCNGIVRYPGEMIAISEELTKEFEARGAVERCKAMEEPPAHEMVTTASRK